jgi:hypothetical protein
MLTDAFSLVAVSVLGLVALPADTAMRGDGGARGVAPWQLRFLDTDREMAATGRDKRARRDADG